MRVPPLRAPAPAPAFALKDSMDAYEDSSYHSTSEAEPESDADADADGDGDADGEADADADADADPDDPERLLNEWLGELDSLTVGLESGCGGGVGVGGATLRPLAPAPAHLNTPRIDSYRFSMANLEESQDVDLDAILGELCALDAHAHAHAHALKGEDPKGGPAAPGAKRPAAVPSGPPGPPGPPGAPSPRTDSPDNDSAFSDNVSMLSSESSASSGGSGGRTEPNKTGLVLETSQMDQASRVKAEKIRIALEKMKEASVKKLFIKAFSADGSTKSLLVDEKMTCAYVTRLLADKNHVPLDPKWAVVEHLPDLFMERVYEDHELLVENLMMWTRDSKNRLLFLERPDKVQLFTAPERFLLSPSASDRGAEFDDHARSLLLEEYFSSTGVGIPDVEGPLYLKSESKKGWKKYHFVLRASGLYYWPKEKAKSSRDLVCLATLDVNQVYYGLGWRKKYKAPTDHCFAIKHPRLQQPKSTKFIKFLCAEDAATLERWVMGVRLAKHGQQLMENYRTLVDDLAQDDIDLLANARSYSVSSIAGVTQARTPCSDDGDLTPSGGGLPLNTAPSGGAPRLRRQDSGRSRASSSSSSGCLSDGAPSSVEVGFECEFPTGTIKRKPSMNPKLPLTSITRQLKEVGETVLDGEVGSDRCASPGSGSSKSGGSGGTLTRNGLVRQSRRRSCGSALSSSTEDSNTDTLKRYTYQRSSLDSSACGGSISNSSSNTSTPIREQIAELPLESPTSLYGRSEGFPETKTVMSPPPQSMTDSIMSLPSPVEPEGNSLCDTDNLPFPPPPPEMFQSTLSLDSLPPPPLPSELPVYSDLGGSSLSLLSLPPPPSPCVDAGLVRRQPPKPSTPDTSGTVTPTNTLSPVSTPVSTPVRPVCMPSPLAPPKPMPLMVRQGSWQHHEPAEGSPAPVTHYATLPYLAELKAGSPMLARKASVEGKVISSPMHPNLSSPPGPDVTPKSPILVTKQRTRTITKKISFVTPDETVISSPKPSSPTYASRSLPAKKPFPPKRSESTRLSTASPKKLSDSDSAVTPPPKDFLKDLQRIMKKKWQVAQKCKLDHSTTPHEVLGFRDPPPPVADYRETNVSNWVQEHYGHWDNVYENVYLVDRAPPGPDALPASPASVKPRLAAPSGIAGQECYARPQSTNVTMVVAAAKKRPPPPPPKRSETTHLTTTRLH
ncbi:hypothetical protein R5R35_013521 [Gryllus longicercus]|uniref:Amyloid beta A4 precursor protein-binding family B member 1-interacting protein n=2 Tax=Gryllus longicercus TaxID=2509291 RepID=A0AAN9VB87_9ORTH